jgi:hypothetical protein
MVPYPGPDRGPARTGCDFKSLASLSALTDGDVPGRTALLVSHNSSRASPMARRISTDGEGLRDNIPRQPRPRPAAAMRELRRLAASYARREAKVNQQREQLRLDRLEAIRKAYNAGVPSTAIGEELGVSKQRILELLKAER